MESFSGMGMAGGKSHLAFPEDLSYNTDYAGNYMMFTAMKVSGGVDTRTLKFALAEGTPGVVCLPIPQGLSAAYQNNWDQSEVGGMMSAGVSATKGAIDSIKEVAKQGTLTGMVGAAASAGKDFVAAPAAAPIIPVTVPLLVISATVFIMPAPLVAIAAVPPPTSV